VKSYRIVLEQWDRRRVRALVKMVAYTACNIIGACLHPLVLIRNRFLSPSRVRVLVYHRICEMQSGRWQADLDVPPTLFAAHMRALVEGGYTVLTAGEVIQRLRDRKHFPPKTVCITFDDGYRNNFTNAFCELQRCGLKASFFVVTDYIGSGRRFAWLSTKRTCYPRHIEDSHIWEPLTWADLLKMNAGEMEVASHSCTHADFSQLELEEIRHEVSDSRRALVMRLGGNVSRVFVCPFGAEAATAAQLVRVLHENGYVGAFTGRTGAVGPKSDPFDLPRFTIYHDDSVAIFRRKVDGAYDWLMWFQPVWLRVTQGRQRLKNRKGGNHAGTESRNPLAGEKL